MRTCTTNNLFKKQQNKHSNVAITICSCIMVLIHISCFKPRLSRQAAGHDMVNSVYDDCLVVMKLIDKDMIWQKYIYQYSLSFPRAGPEHSPLSKPDHSRSPKTTQCTEKRENRDTERLENNHSDSVQVKMHTTSTEWSMRAVCTTLVAP